MLCWRCVHVNVCVQSAYLGTHVVCLRHAVVVDPVRPVVDQQLIAWLDVFVSLDAQLQRWPPLRLLVGEELLDERAVGLLREPAVVVD